MVEDILDLIFPQYLISNNILNLKNTYSKMLQNIRMIPIFQLVAIATVLNFHFNVAIASDHVT